MALKVSKISIHNILGVEDLEFEIGKMTVIQGANGTGKTSVLEAIRAVFRGGTDVTLIRNGAIEGEICLELSDGTELDKRISETNTKVTVKHPIHGKISKPQTIIDGLMNQLGVNPIDLLNASTAKQKELFLKAIPLTVTQEQVETAIGMPIKGNYDRHALDVIDDVNKALYDNRTDVNRALKEKQSTAKQLEASLPELPPEGDWQGQYEALSAQLNELERKHHKRLQDMEESKHNSISQVREEMSARIAEMKHQAQIAIDLIKAELDKASQEVQEENTETVRRLLELASIVQEEIKNETDTARRSLLEQKQHAKTMVDMNLKAESTRNVLDQMQLDYAKLLTKSKDLTSGLDGLNKLKEKLVSGLPIHGLEVRDGELYLHAIPLSRWNEAVRVRLAIDIAKLSVGDLGLILVDGLEKLDTESFKAFSKYVQEDDTCQYVVSKVTDSPTLAIEVLNGASSSL